jgi:hypothetical protein
MGYQTTIVINNDRLTDISNDVTFGASVVAAVNEVSLGRPVEMRRGYGVAIESHHADSHVLVQTGNCSGSMVGGYVHWSKAQWELSGVGSDEFKLELLRSAAEALGYNLHKKRTN